MTQSSDNSLDIALQALSGGVPEHAFIPLKACLTQDPSNAQAWFLLGAAHDQSGQTVEAEQAFRKAVQLMPNHPQAANAQAAMLVKLGETEAALDAFRQALLANPHDAQILTNIGIGYESLQRFEEALNAYCQALAIDTNHLGALNNRGALLVLLGLKEQALEDHLRFVKLAPQSLNGHYFCAETYSALHSDEEALASCEAALSINPRHAKSLFLRAVTLSSLRRWAEAERAFTFGLEAEPEAFHELLTKIGIDTRIWKNGIPDTRNIYCFRMQERLRVCNWSRYQEYLGVVRELVPIWTTSKHHIADSALAHMKLALPLSSQDQASLARCFAKGIIAQHSNLTEFTSDHQKNYETGKRRLRIGYVSPDFRKHATSHLTNRLYALHDRTQFEIYGYSLFNEVSGVDVQKQIANDCNVFRDVSKCTDEEIKAHIQKDKIDILIDLAGYTAHARPALFTEHSAPISAAYLGYAGSIGHDSIDYYISDNVICSPEQQRFYSEQIVTLPRASFCYNDQQAIAAPQTRKHYALPQEAFVFCCFNNSWKLEPNIFSLWMRLLQRLPHSVLWLYKPTPDVEKNLRIQAAKHGVDPNRLIFAPTLPVEQHLARYQVADLFLDTHYYGGHTTSMDALWAGLPVLARPGETNASRVSTSHLLALDLPELVTDSEEAYEELAYALANDKERLHSIRSKLARNRQEKSLFKTDDLVRNLERAYHAMWQRHQAGLPPAPIHLS